jgi:hypothetical protein
LERNTLIAEPAGHGRGGGDPDTHMKNANVFVDVDLTLIDANGRFID